MSISRQKSARPLGSDPAKAAYAADVRRAAPVEAAELRVPETSGSRPGRRRRPTAEQVAVLAELRAVAATSDGVPAELGPASGTGEASVETGAAPWPYDRDRRARRR